MRSLVSFQIAETLQKSLKDHFFLSSGIRIIAEPGRYFIDGAFASACEITAVKFPEEGIGEEDGSVEVTYGLFSAVKMPSLRSYMIM